MHRLVGSGYAKGLARCLMPLVAAMLLLGGCRQTTPEQPPVADFVHAPAEVRVNEEVAFDASASHAPAGEIVAYTWAFGDGAAAEGMNAVHTYAEEGTYTVTLTVIDDAGREAQQKSELTVLPAAAVPPDEHTLTVHIVGNGTVTKDPDRTTYTEGTTVELTATPAAGWVFSGWSGDLSGTDNPKTLTMDAHASVTATFNEPDPTDPADPPEAAFTFAPEHGFLPLTVSFDASSSSGDIASYTWTFGDGATGTGVTSQHTYTEEGQHVVRLTVQDDQGREASAEAMVVAYPPLQPPPGG